MAPANPTEPARLVAGAPRATSRDEDRPRDEERVAVALTGAPGGEHLIRRAAAVADRMNAPVLGIHVQRTDGGSDGDQAPLERHARLLQALGGDYREVASDDVADALLSTALAEGATQIFLGASRRSRWSEFTRGSVVNRLIRQSAGIDVHVISTNDRAAEDVPRRAASRPRSRRAPLFAPRRRLLSFIGAVAGPAALTAVLHPLREHLSLSTVLLLFLSVVVADAGAGGTAPAVVAAITAMLLVNWFFTPPYGTIEISDSENLIALAVFVAIGTTVAALLERALRRRIEVERVRTEADRLARDLREGEAESDRLAQANALRTALLRAVSHDLRTPLASIKASVTSLLQRDVHWSPADTGTFLRTIDQETDRLDRLVGNLLDMGRLEVGAVEVTLRPAPVDELLSSALDEAGGTPARVRLEVPDDLPDVRVDPALLERALANVIANALRHSPVDRSVRLVATDGAANVVIEVVDEGPGIGPNERARAMEPFQRLGDRRVDPGVGLGLAVAAGLTTAMGGTLSLEDTPGGGLTVRFGLPRSDAVASAAASGTR